VLLPLADLDTQWHRIGAREPNPLADAVLRSKRAGKWATSYARAMLEMQDADGYIHPSINTMGARTARWAVSSPPLQQLPSSDWRSEEHTSELQSRENLVCRLLTEK